MIIRWPYLIGLIPLLLLIIPNRRSVRISIALLSAAILLYIWSGMAKAQQIEKDFIGWTLRDLAMRIEQGQATEVCAALTLYAKTQREAPFDGFKFRIFMQNHFDPKNINQSEQGGPAYPPQGVGSADP